MVLFLFFAYFTLRCYYISFQRDVEPELERVRPRKRVFVNPNVAQMREALGIGKRVERVG